MDGEHAITRDGLEALQQELEHLQTTKRAEIAARIKTAREYGDLKENAEYHIAKEDQAHLETRIKRLNERLRHATVVDAPAQDGVVGFGSTVEVRDEGSGKQATYTLVGAAEAKAADGRLSIESPVAQALLGARAGDAVPVQTPGGARTFHVVRVGA
jgi:transcription elongation factor GreA